MQNTDKVHKDKTQLKDFKNIMGLDTVDIPVIKRSPRKIKFVQ